MRVASERSTTRVVVSRPAAVSVPQSIVRSTEVLVYHGPAVRSIDWPRRRGRVRGDGEGRGAGGAGAVGDGDGLGAGRGGGVVPRVGGGVRAGGVVAAAGHAGDGGEGERVDSGLVVDRRPGDVEAVRVGALRVVVEGVAVDVFERGGLGERERWGGGGGGVDLGDRAGERRVGGVADAVADRVAVAVAVAAGDARVGACDERDGSPRSERVASPVGEGGRRSARRCRSRCRGRSRCRLPLSSGQVNRQARVPGPVGEVGALPGRRGGVGGDGERVAGGERRSR